MTGVALNSVTINLPRNGTTAHTLDPTNATGGGTVVAGSAFTPTAGRLLVAFVEGAVTSTTPSGWTLPSGGSAINFSGLYVFTKTAASGSNAASTTHNASNYPVVVTFLEYAAGSTFDQVVAATPATKTAASGALTGLTGTKTVIGVVANDYDATTGTSATTWTASSGSPVKDFDITVVRSGTDGYGFSLAYIDGFAGSTWTPTGSIVNSSAVTAKECLTVALTVASSGTPANVTGTPGIAFGEAPGGTPTAGASLPAPAAVLLATATPGAVTAAASVVGAPAVARLGGLAGIVTAGGAIVGSPATSSGMATQGAVTVPASVTGSPAAARVGATAGAVTAAGSVSGSPAAVQGFTPPGVPVGSGAATVNGVPAVVLGITAPGVAVGSGAASVTGVPAVLLGVVPPGVATAGSTASVVGVPAAARVGSTAGIVTAGAVVIGAPSRSTATSTAGTVTAGAAIGGTPSLTIGRVPAGLPVGGGPALVVGAPALTLGVVPAGTVVVGPIVHVLIPSHPELFVVYRRTLDVYGRRALGQTVRHVLTEPEVY